MPARKVGGRKGTSQTMAPRSTIEAVRDSSTDQTRARVRSAVSDSPKRVTGWRAVPRVTRHCCDNGYTPARTRLTGLLLPLRPKLFFDLHRGGMARCTRPVRSTAMSTRRSGNALEPLNTQCGGAETFAVGYHDQYFIDSAQSPAFHAGVREVQKMKPVNRARFVVALRHTRPKAYRSHQCSTFSTAAVPWTTSLPPSSMMCWMNMLVLGLNGCTGAPNHPQIDIVDWHCA
jgi:hypothetical protein